MCLFLIWKLNNLINHFTTLTYVLYKCSILTGLLSFMVSLLLLFEFFFHAAFCLSAFTCHYFYLEDYMSIIANLYIEEPVIYVP